MSSATAEGDQVAQLFNPLAYLCHRYMQICKYANMYVCLRAHVFQTLEVESQETLHPNGIVIRCRPWSPHIFRPKRPFEGGCAGIMDGKIKQCASLWQHTARPGKGEGKLSTWNCCYVLSISIFIYKYIYIYIWTYYMLTPPNQTGV